MVYLSNEILFKKVKAISNRKRFWIIELTQNKEMNITELKKELNLAYNKCADYVRMLEKLGLIKKTKKGREMNVKATVLLKNIQI